MDEDMILGDNPSGGNPSASDIPFIDGPVANTDPSGPSSSDTLTGGSNYIYDFSSFDQPSDGSFGGFGGGNNTSGGQGSDAGDMMVDTSVDIQVSPFDELLDLPGIDSLDDIFGDVGVPGLNYSFEDTFGDVGVPGLDSTAEGVIS